MKSFGKKYWIWFITLFVVYVVTAKIGLSMDALSGFASLIWPPSGIAFAALSILGTRLWPAITLGAFVVNLNGHDSTLFISSSMALGNTLEALTGVYLFKKVAGSSTALEKISDILALLFLVSVLSTTISATIGVASLYLSGIIPSGAFGQYWRAWWIGDSVSILVIAPIFLVWSRFPKAKFNFGRVLEGIILGTFVLFLSYLIFGHWLDAETRHYILPFWMFPLLIWTNLRFGQHANIIFVFAVSAIAIWGTNAGYGPFVMQSKVSSLLSLQLFITTITVTGLFFGALGREKEEALRVRNDFLSIASHELKTPITSLKLKIQVLKTGLEDKFLGPDSEKIFRMVGSSDRQLDRLAKIVDDLLDITRIEAKNLDMEVKEMDLTDSISETAETFRDFMLEENCELVVSLEPSVRGRWNQYRIEQVLTNLLINAMKYGSGKPVKLSLYTQNKMAVFSVEDFGIGIAKENQVRIFDRFERVEESHNINGIGLGLYISKQIVEAHNGTLSVLSEHGQGAIFTVALPLER